MKYEEYKDSGVEWIGEVPSHWEVMRFKDFTSLQTTTSDNMNKIGLENIEGKTGRFIESDSEFEGNGIAFNIGDVVYGKLRPYLQKVWIATFSGNAVGDFSCSVPKIIVIINICFIACYQMVSRLCVMVQLLGQKCLGYLPIS